VSKTHTIKINDWFVDDILSGRKRIEVRENDHLYQTGDLIKFAPINARYQLQTLDGGIITSTDKLDGKVYKITFVESGYGLQNGYVAFGFEEVVEDAKSSAILNALESMAEVQKTGGSEW